MSSSTEQSSCARVDPRGIRRSRHSRARRHDERETPPAARKRRRPLRLRRACRPPDASRARRRRLELRRAGRSPDIYDWDCSHYALELGLELSRRLDIELLYVSLTDAVQHAAGARRGAERPLPAQARRARRRLPRRRLAARARRRPRHEREGRQRGPAERALPHRPPRAGGRDESRMSCCRSPIPTSSTMPRSAPPAGFTSTTDDRDAARRTIEGVDGVEEVLDRASAAERFMLPAGPDRRPDRSRRSPRRSSARARPTTISPSCAARCDRTADATSRQIPILLSEDPRVAPGATFTNADIHSLVLGDAR